MLEPFICLPSYNNDKELVLKAFIQTHFKGIKELFDLQRVIDCYLIDFKRISVADSDAKTYGQSL